MVVVPAARKPAVAPRKHQPTAVKKPAASGSRLLMYSNTVPIQPSGSAMVPVPKEEFLRHDQRCGSATLPFPPKAD